MNVKIVKTNGEIYETPLSNLENVKRLIKYTDIIYPTEESTGEATEIRTKPETAKVEAKAGVKPKGKGKK